MLAFTNFSDDKANEYFSDGVSEELLNALAKVPGLKVSARTSSFFFKGKTTSIADIARQLGVAYIIEGSVRRDGNEVRITAQLIKASDGFHVWSDTFTREMKNVFALQDEIAGLIARNFQLQVASQGRPTPVAIRPDAIALYLEGRREWNVRTAESVTKAQALFSQAIAMEPRFARAYAGLADALFIQGQFPDPRFDSLAEKAKTEALRALELDPNLPEAYATLGALAERRRDTVEAEKQFRRALALNPNYPPAHQWLGRMFVRIGEAEKGIAEMQLAVQLDPFAPILQANVALGYLWTRQPSKALEAADRSLAIQPDFIAGRTLRAAALIDLKRFAEAATVLRALLQLTPGQTQSTAQNFSSRRSSWMSQLAEAEGTEAVERDLARLRGEEPADLSAVALRLAYLKRWDEAFSTLWTVEGKDVRNLSSLLDPVWDPVRDDVRFQQFVEQSSHREAYRKQWRYIQEHQESR